MSLLTKFLSRYPEFEPHDEDRIELFLSDAQTELSPRHWGRLYERGVMALAAHFLSLEQRREQGQGEGQRLLASETAGELSVSYAVPAESLTNQAYHLTAYGQEYLRLKRLIGVGVMVV